MKTIPVPPECLPYINDTFTFWQALLREMPIDYRHKLETKYKQGAFKVVFSLSMRQGPGGLWTAESEIHVVIDDPDAEPKAIAFIQGKTCELYLPEL